MVSPRYGDVGAFSVGRSDRKPSHNQGSRIRTAAHLYGSACGPAMIFLGGTLGCKPHNEYYSSTLIPGISKNSQHPPWAVHAAYWGHHIRCPRPLSPPPVIPGRNLWVRGWTASLCVRHCPEKSYKLYSKTVLVGVWVVFNHTVMHKPVNVPTQVIRPIGYLVL